MIPTTLAIDPGTDQSQFLVWDGHGQRVGEFGLLPNLELLESLRGLMVGAHCICIEGVASYGMPVGAETFTTCIWIGRFIQKCVEFGTLPEVVYRKDVKMHLCHKTTAKDANIRQALIDRFGGKEKAIGRKAAPGPLYGISSHAWAALALAVTFSDTHQSAARQQTSPSTGSRVTPERIHDERTEQR